MGRGNRKRPSRSAIDDGADQGGGEAARETPQQVRVYKTARAQKDLLEIWAYVYADVSESVADRLLGRIAAKLVLLSEFPFAGAARDDIRRGFRMLVSDEYLILYRILKKEIEVVRVVHGRRNLPKLDWRT